MRKGLACTLTVAALLALPAGAAANHHLMVISEVHPGTGAPANDAFVELQMYAAGQEVVGGQTISYYSAEGLNTPFSMFAANVAKGESQRTILVGDTAVANPDLLDTSLDDDIGGPGGAVCFESTVFPSPIDCVAWGTFDNSAPQLPVGSPAPAIPSGQSLTRSIAPGCPTLLEGSDDTDDSAADFVLATPTPRPNAVTPTETDCSGGPADTNPPQTRIKKAPKGKIDTNAVKVRFKSDEPGSSFECKLDGRRFKPCKSPKKLKHLDHGKHKFSVRATDSAGNTDSSPAKAKFKVVG